MLSGWLRLEAEVPALLARWSAERQVSTTVAEAQRLMRQVQRRRASATFFADLGLNAGVATQAERIAHFEQLLINLGL